MSRWTETVPSERTGRYHFTKPTHELILMGTFDGSITTDTMDWMCTVIYYHFFLRSFHVWSDTHSWSRAHKLTWLPLPMLYMGCHPRGCSVLIDHQRWEPYHKPDLSKSAWGRASTEGAKGVGRLKMVWSGVGGQKSFRAGERAALLMCTHIWLDLVSVNPIHLVHLLGWTKLDQASHLLPDQKCPNICVVWHLGWPRPS